MTTRVPIRYGGTGANTAADARAALGVSSSATTNAAYAQANSAYGQANLAYTQANNAYGQANSAFGQANLAYTQANNAYGQANLAYTQANTATTQASDAYSQANSAYGQANTARDQANSAYTQANNAYGQANSAYTQANSSYTQANLAYGQANSAYNAANNARVTVFANNGAANATTQNINFVNTSTILVTVANTSGNANVSFISTDVQANAAYGQANLAYTQANSAANTVRVSQNGASTLSAKQLNFVNTANVTIVVTDSGNGNANIEFDVAAGGGTLSNIGISSNGVFTTNANGFNFVNTATVSVTVQSGVNGNANISFAAEGTTTTFTKQTFSSANASGNLVYALNLTPLYEEAVFVNKNGVALVPGTEFTLSGNTITVVETGEANDTIDVRYLVDSSVVPPNNTIIIVQANTPAAQTSTFTLSHNVTSINLLRVTKNGLRLTPNTHYTLSGNTVTLTSVAEANDDVLFEYFYDVGSIQFKLGFERNSFVGDGNTVNFQLNTAPSNEDNCLVFVDRILQRNSEYDVTASTLTFTGAPDANAVIDVFVTTQVAANNGVIKTGDTMTGNLNVAATLITQNVEPATNITYNLGTSTKRFKDLWLSNSTIYLGETTISASGNKLIVPAIETTSGVNVEAQVANSYNQANAAYGQANLAYTAANNAYGQANLAYTQANNAYGQANLAYTQANNAYTQANNSYGQANLAYTAANNRVLKAGDTMTGQLNVSSGGLLVTGNVGLGIAAPTSNLHVVGNANITTGINTATINVTTANVGTVVGTSALTLSTGTGSNGNIVFSANGTEYVRVTSGGSVGIGTTIPAYKLDVTGTTRSVVNGRAFQIQPSTNTTQSYIGFSNDNFVSNRSAIGIDNSTGTGLWVTGGSAYSLGIGTVDSLPIVFATNNTERIRIPNNAGGITFPATQAASSDANTLDDYEEGTWTPDVYNNGSSSTWTVKIGRYTKIGNLVTCWFNCDGGNSGTAGGALLLTGLPFSDIGDGNWQALGFATTVPAVASEPIMMQGSGGSTAQIWSSGAGQDTSQRTYISGIFAYRS